MRTQERRIALADGRTRFILTILDDDAPDGKDIRRPWFLQTIADNEASLARPGGGAWETMTIRHDGTRWLAETEATHRELRA